MVYATIQVKDDMSKNLVAKNGKLINDRFEIGKPLSEIDEKVKIKKWYYDGSVRRINKSDLYCYLNHPEVDIANRKRIGLVIWDKNDSEETIKETINAMGLDIN